MSDFGETRFHVGRKVHRCEWCGETIPVGEEHAHFAGKWEDEWQDWRMHRECYTAGHESSEISEGFAPYEHQRGSQEPA